MLDDFELGLTVIRAEYLVLNIKPKAKQSTTFGRKRAFTSKKKKGYILDLCRQIEEKYKAPKLCGQIRVTVLYSFPWRIKDKHIKDLEWILATAGTDVDNLTKPVFDSLQGICFENDSEIVELRARKIRSEFMGIAMRLDEVLVNRPA